MLIIILLLGNSCKEKEIIDVSVVNKDISFQYNRKDSSEIICGFLFNNSEWFSESFMCHKDSSYHLSKVLINSNYFYDVAYYQAMNDSFPLTHFIKQDTVLLFDTTFYYRMPITSYNNDKYAKLVSGNFSTVELYSAKDEIKNVKKYLVNQNIRLDSTRQWKMAEILASMNSGGKATYKLMRYPSIYKSISGLQAQIETNLDYNYYYFIAASDSFQINEFAKGQIIKDFSEGKKNDVNGKILLTLNLMKADEWKNKNYLFLLGINSDWTYDYLPIGSIIEDNQAPIITLNKGYDTLFQNSFGNQLSQQYRNFSIWGEVEGICKSEITSITWGNFEGNDWSGYDIPFTIGGYFGDLKEIVIQNKRFLTLGIIHRVNLTCHFPKLNIGDNFIKIFFIDIQGNTSSTTINIALERVKNNNAIENNIYNNIYR
jgi:hypothetical protein